MWIFFLTVALFSVIQRYNGVASGCQINSVTSPSASTLYVKWSSYTGATVYVLDLRVVNSSTIAPVMLMQTAASTERLVQGLRPGTAYEVTLKAYQILYNPVCTVTVMAKTVPGTSQITFAQAINSSSLQFEWSGAAGADSYILVLEELNSDPLKSFNWTFTSLSGQVSGLSSATRYACYLYTENSAGRGAKSGIRTIVTLVQPPTGLTVTTKTASSVQVQWSPVDKVLQYLVAVRDTNSPNSPVIKNTSSTSTEFTSLKPCSTYTVEVSSYNIFLVPGEPSIATYITSSIDTVTTTSAAYTCSNGSVTVSWDGVPGASLYRATAVDGTGASLNCTSASTSCQISMLTCGERYQVRVTAISGGCESTSNTSTMFETVPCAPTNLQTSHVCLSDMITFSWQPTNNTIYYEATATDRTGRVTLCRTIDSACFFTNIGCGQHYTYRVRAVSFECNSQDSQPKVMQSSPCEPTNIRSEAACDSGKLITTWEPSPGALFYRVEAKGNNGELYNCSSPNNSCAITGVPCGEFLSVSIVASNDNCSSGSVLGQAAQTNPCPPTNVEVSETCSPDSATVNWLASNGAIFYYATAHDANGNTHECFSLATSCSIRGLKCGQNYTATISGNNFLCNSTQSQEVAFTTGLCAPANVEAFTDCDANQAVVNWQNSKTSGHYTAMIEDESGAKLTCTSDKLNCNISSLPCGKKLNVTVTYTDGNCSSTSTPVSMDSVPCAPEAVMVSVNCSTEELTITWSNSSPAEKFSAVISGATDQPLHCNSTDTHCTVGGLTCGSLYNVTVSSFNGTCLSPPSSEVTVQTTPCPPTNVSAVHTCAPDPVPVSWAATGIAKQYTAVAVSQGGHKSECTTNQTSCSLPGLQCGETYYVHVSGANNNCSSQQSNSVSIHTEPCPPANVTSHLINGAAQVTWSPGANAASYNVKATSYSHITTCSSFTSNCTLSDLVCGQDYDIQVSASDGTCASDYSTPFKQNQVQCSSWNFTTDLKCETNELLVSWNASFSELNYSVTAAPMDGNIPPVTCHTNNSSCLLSGLQCGHFYNVSIKVSSDTFSGPQTPSVTVKTAPCAPAIQSSTLICGNSSSLLTWAPVSDTTGYIVTAKTTKGHEVSCSSTTTSCTLTNLTCSETYMATVTAQGLQCNSAPSLNTNITTTPCPPAVISRQYNCGTNTAVFSLSDPTEAHTILAQIVGDGFKDSCLTTNASCVFQSLPCGLDLNLTVQTQGSECNSSVSVSEPLQTAPCPPENVSATFLCSNHSALITWVGSPKALWYNVTATGLGGSIHSCHTNTSSCEVTDLQCGETYSVKVTAHTQTCTGSQSLPHKFRAGFCPPSNITVLPTCEHRAISWSSVAWAETYTATATAADGHTHTCSSNYSNSCNFTDLHCGEAYSVTVVSGDGSCWSEPSAWVQLIAALCPSGNLTARVNCNTSTVDIMWTSVAAPSYVIRVENIGGLGTPVEYTTPNISLSLSNLACGERYAFSLAVQDGNCQSSFSPPIEISTVPCQPSNLTAQVDCGTNNGNFSWAESSGAHSYTVEVKGADGHMTSCSSNTTSCSVKLHCGYSYHATVVASTDSCDTSKNTEIFFESAPCLPEDVVAKLDCESHVINVNWTQTNGFDDYTAWAISSDGHRASCNSTTNSCSIHDLLCGKIYEVAVTSSSIKCQVIAGSDYKVQSYPCAPINTSVEQNCSFNSMTVKWHDNTTVQNYTVKATSASGVNSTCESTNSSCSFLDLSCGQIYSFTVMGHSDVCTSEVSTPITSYTAPCPPINLSAEQNCSTHTAVVSWKTVATAVIAAYNVQATSPDGHNSSCSSVGSTCNLHELVCGQNYSVVVETINSGCLGPASAPSFITTEPCIPMNVSTRYNMSAAWVMWSTAAGASSYTVQAVTDSGAPVTCGSSNSSCHLNGLQCSRMYNVTVTAQNQACSSLPSETTHLLTEPCPPQNIQASLNCEHLTATVSWQQSHLSVGYVAYADDNNGHRTYCFSANATSCSLSWLMCGKVYNVWVKALGQQYNSSDSSVVSLTSAPCQLGNVEANMDCAAHTATASWQSSSGASSYVAVLTASSGHMKSCTTNHTSCQLSSLQCGEKYNLTVEAFGETCNITTPMTGYLITEPCAPVNLSVLYNVSTAQVMWAGAKDGGSFTVAAVNNRDPAVICNSTNSLCSLVGLECSQSYNITVMVEDPTCNNTVASEPYLLMTEPCPPTNIQASLKCEPLTATVSWQQTGFALGYIAYLKNKSGHQTSCVSSATSCSISGLTCGAVYSVWVKALGQQYNSSDSSVISLTSAPCQLGNVEANMDCAAHTATASWQSSSGASSYVAVLTASSGHMKSCTTNHTSCQLSSLQCGEKYNLTVEAFGETCNITTPMTGYLITEPCAPVNLSVLYNVSTAQVMWAGAKDGGSFTVAAVNNRDPAVICNSTNSLCSLVGLECSQSYNITVMVEDPTCNNTVASEPYLLMTEPCPPTNIQASLKCEPLTATVSWQQTGFALGYIAYLKNKSGHQTSCVSSNATSCSISGLTCGAVYSVWVKALGQQHNSSDSSIISLTSGPCQPVIDSVQVPCQSDEVQISWNQTDGAVNYVVRTTGNHGYVRTHNTTQSFLSATFPCGQEFNVTVQGQGSVCDSIPSSPAFFKTAPCIPSNVTTQVQCEFNQGSVSWRPSDGAESYIAIATGLDSHTHLCLTNTTSCTWTDLHCGEEYTVVVRAKADNCSSLPSNSSVIYTDPCAPQNLDATVNCGTKVVALSWNSPNGTHLYTVSAEGRDKSISLHTNTTTALFSELTCGQNYSLTVMPHSQHCAGNYNAHTSVLTWPCTPAGVSASQACLSNSVTVRWQPSNGSAHYTAIVQTETGISEACTTAAGECSVHAVTCGQNYSVSVTAFNEQCNVTSGQTTNVQSVPCSPTNVSVHMDCTTNSAVVSWSASRGAVQYSVIAISSHGNDSCQTSGLSCRLSLACGSLYMVEVVALDDNCSSVPSSPVEFSSGPCSPGNVSAHMTCLSNNMTVSWDAVRDADHFLVSLTSVNGTIELCNTTTTACYISNATCGETFTIQVISVRGSCLSQPYQSSSIQTAPCQPKIVNGTIDCVSNSAWILWDAALGASNYTVSAVGSDISTTNCTSITDTKCEVKDLACGVSFNFTVTATNSRCDSQPSAPLSLETAPCSLSAITAFAQCHNSSILVMWDLKRSGRTSVYIATAEASDHTFLTCNGTDSSCYLSEAKCDLQYTIIVAASSDRCSSLRSPPYRISMEPCPPTNVSVNASCETHSAVISWAQSPVAESYQVVATAADGHKHICNTSSSSCSLTELHCDEQYTVSVTASHENCSSKASQNATLNTGPCQPSNVAVSYNCSSRSALLTWMPSKNSLDYYGSAQAGSGDKIHCHNTNPTCTIDNLECGVSYNFSVQASDGTCNSSYSDLVQFGGAPCPPDGIKVQLLPMEMEVQLLHFRWTHVTCGNVKYLLTLTGSLQGDDTSNLFEFSSYWTSTDFFEIPLPCSSSYSARLQSRNAAGTSDKSAPLNGTTAPCPPSGIVFRGNSSLATVSWNMSVFATTYTVYDDSVKPRVQLCNTTTLSCSLISLFSNNLVITASNAAGESQTANVPNVVLQRRRRDLEAQLSKDGSASAPLLEVTQVIPTGFRLQWSPVEKASHYSLLIIQQGSSDSQKLTVYGESINVTDLSPNSAYCFSVMAVYASADGPPSEPVCTQTIQVLQ